MEVMIKIFYVKSMKSIELKYFILLLIVLVISTQAFSQNKKNPFYLWKLNAISGEARFNGFIREQERAGLNFNDNQKSSFLSGGMFLNTTSSVLHKNFLLLDINAAFMPEKSNDIFIISPDQSEVRTTKKLDVGATFFNGKKINLNLFNNYNESYSSRENITDIKSTNSNFGIAFSFTNKFLPFSLFFNKRKWNEEELNNGKIYKIEQKIFGAQLSKSFTKYDRNELKYSHDENMSINQNLFRLANTTDNFDFVNQIYLDFKKKYSFNTLITNINQKGIANINRFQINESVSFILPANLSFTGNYNFYNIKQDFYEMKQHTINSGLEHKLFKSLKSRINFEYNTINHSIYNQSSSKYGVEFNYSKQIPTGQLLLSYRFDRFHQSYFSDPLSLTILDEQYTLTDSKIILLKLPNINVSSIIVKDKTGTIIYQKGVDYILIERSKYIEIRRIPGGSIADKSLVLIDYYATQPGTYKYDANIQVLNSDIFLFKNILSFSYRFSTQNYINLKETEFITLNYFTQNLFGCRIDFNFMNIGAEYEIYKSSILPYRKVLYFINFQKRLSNELMFMLNGDIQNYEMMEEADANYQKYMNATAKIIYHLIRQTNLNIDLMYRKQSGSNIDLSLITAKTEISSYINNLNLTLGFELYKRNYVGEKINFKSVFVKIIRKF